MEIERGAAQFDLSVSVDLSMKRTVSFEYSTDLFHGDRIERMAAHLWTLLEAVIADPNLPIAQVPIVPASERLALERMSAGPAMPVDHGVDHARLGGAAGGPRAGPGGGALSTTRWSPTAAECSGEPARAPPDGPGGRSG